MAALAKPTDSRPIRYGLSPHSLYACSDELLRRAGDALACTGCHLQIHLAETKEEVAELHARTGARPVERLEYFGLLSSNVVIAHGVWLDDDECRRLARAGASIAHNVSSNMKLASGVAPLTRFTMAGLNVALGTDSSASNNVLDPFREMRLATLMQRALARDPAAWPAYAALEAATRHGAAALGFGDETAAWSGASAPTPYSLISTSPSGPARTHRPPGVGQPARFRCHRRRRRHGDCRWACDHGRTRSAHPRSLASDRSGPRRRPASARAPRARDDGKLTAVASMQPP